MLTPLTELTRLTAPARAISAGFWGKTSAVSAVSALSACQRDLLSASPSTIPDIDPFSSPIIKTGLSQINKWKHVFCSQ
jgi:hypothetical protein